MHLLQWLEASGGRKIDLARTCGVGNSTITKWLYGWNNPLPEAWRKIADATDYYVTPNDHILGIPLTEEQRLAACAERDRRNGKRP